MADKALCQECGTTWTALGECHCTRCHQHFSNIKSFDKHQVEDIDGRGNYKGSKCLTEQEIRNHVTEQKRTGNKFPTFAIRPDVNHTVALNDPYRDERLDKMAATKSTTKTKTAAKGKTTKASTAKPKAEKRVCAEDGCKRILKKKPGRGRWPVRCQKHGGTGLV